MSESDLRIGVAREILERRELRNWEEVAKLGPEVRIVSPCMPAEYESSSVLPVTTVRSAASIARSGTARRLVRAAHGIAAVNRYAGLERALSECDVLSVMETHGSLAAQVAELGTRSRRPVIVHVYENIAFLHEEIETVRSYKDTVRGSATLFIAVSPEARDALISEGVDPATIVVVPFGIDTAGYQMAQRDPSLRRAWGVDDDTVIFLYLGRYLREKGLAQLLLAFADVCRDVSAHLVLAGKGPEEPKLLRMIDRLGLSRYVSLQPWLPSESVPTALKSADVFVLPSLSAPYWLEQLGYVLLEAMAAGMPIAAASTGSIPWVVGDAAQLFDPFNIVAVAESLRILALDSGRRATLVSAATERSAQFDVRVIAEQIVGEVRRVC